MKIVNYTEWFASHIALVLEVDDVLVFNEGTVNSFVYNGKVIIRCWGSASASRKSTSDRGRGGYATGLLISHANQLFWAVVGTYKKSFNGNQSACWGSSSYSGAASDIRLFYDGNLLSSESLRSRIIVAGGGGTAGASSRKGGDGGGLVGLECPNTSYGTGGQAGTQTSGFKFGIGEKGTYHASGYGGSGGSGYYGGRGITPDGSRDDDRGGGGGSGFISGYPGCNAIDSLGNHTGQPKHYSGLAFEAPWNLIAGNMTMPSFPSSEGYSTMTGNTNTGLIVLQAVERTTVFANVYPAYTFTEENDIQTFIDPAWEKLDDLYNKP